MKKETKKCLLYLFLSYAPSSFGDLKRYVVIVVGLDEDDNQLTLKQ